MNFKLAYKDKNQIKELITFLKGKGYKNTYELDDGNIDHMRIPAINVDSDNKIIRSESSTIMCCWCSYNRKPLYIDEFINLYQRIVVNKDYDYYHYLTKKNYLDSSRHSGRLVSIDEMKYIKDNPKINRIITLIKETDDLKC